MRRKSRWPYETYIQDLAAYRTSLSNIQSGAKKDHNTLMSKIVEHQTALHQIQNKMEHTERATNAKLDAISHSVVTFSCIRDQVLAFLATFPSELRGLLRNILQSNWQIYQALLEIQKCTAQSPTGLLDSDIKFEDALGEFRQLPYEHFRYWEVSL